MNLYKLFIPLTMIFFLFIAWIIFLANTGQASIFFTLVAYIPFGDKLGHFMLFGILTLFVVISMKFNKIQFAGFKLYFGAVLVSIAALIEELSQFYLPNRTFDITDLIADSLGIIVVCCILKKFDNKKSKLSSS